MIIIRNGRGGFGCFGCFGFILLIGLLFSSCTGMRDNDQPVPRNNVEQPPAEEQVPEGNNDDINVNQF